MSAQITPHGSVTTPGCPGRKSTATRINGIRALLAVLVIALLAACAHTPTAPTASTGGVVYAGPAHADSPYQPSVVSAPTAPPTQINPLPVPANLTPAEALDWRIVQWDKATGTGTDTVMGGVSLNNTTVDWMAYIRAWVGMALTQSGEMIPRFGGRIWTADGVVKDVNSELYPSTKNGTLSVATIGTGTDLSSPGDKIRYVAVGIRPASSLEAVSRMLKLEWYVPSDGVGRPIVTVCPGDDRC